MNDMEVSIPHKCERVVFHQIRRDGDIETKENEIGLTKELGQ